MPGTLEGNRAVAVAILLLRPCSGRLFRKSRRLPCRLHNAYARMANTEDVAKMKPPRMMPKMIVAAKQELTRLPFPRLQPELTRAQQAVGAASVSIANVIDVVAAAAAAFGEPFEPKNRVPSLRGEVRQGQSRLLIVATADGPRLAPACGM